MEDYNPQSFEKKWQDNWEETGLFNAEMDKSREKKYVLSMFPYPSGALHMGHVMNYTINDVVARYYMMKGFNVMTPIGWDSFGLPAENAAIRLGVPPAENIKTNIAKMKEQMKMAGWGFDWKRETATSSIDYYKWTQWLFLKFHEAGLVEKKDGSVNWCPDCNTVLANEQVHDGHCERCNTEVINKDLKQWYFLMSQYSQKLLDGHDNCGEWPERVVKMQKDWIGRSQGATVSFKLENSDKKIDVYTTRPDTLWGVTFMSMAPQHPLIAELIENAPNKAEIEAKVEEMKALGTSDKEVATREKEGVFTGAYAINPVNGDRVPVYVGNFVLMNFGTGVVMAVPTHDQRDFEFAKKYDIPMKVVIHPKGETLIAAEMTEAYTDNGELVDSGEFSGKNNRKVMGDIINWLDKNGYGEKTVNYKLRDWLLSRQRYWGCPIPIVHCDSCGVVPVPVDQLPIKLPDNVEFTHDGDSPLASCEEFVNTTCPTCGKPAKREIDTMDTFVDSSWYYLRYCSPTSDNAPFDKEEANYWGPIDIYIGGIEHATMHLIYVRFFAQVLKELGLIDFTEPTKKLFTQGMVCSEAHYCETHKWLAESEVEDGKCSKCGEPVKSEITKMSKTKLNVVAPEEIISKYGADTMRMYTLSDTPPIKDRTWSEEGVHGIHRFIKRYWETLNSGIDQINSGNAPKDVSAADKELLFKANSALQKIMNSYDENWQFNTAIARVMELVSAFRKSYTDVTAETARTVIDIMLKTMAPIIPHSAEELWAKLGETGSVFEAKFPEVDASALVQDEIKQAVQINGKVRATITVSKDASKEEIEKIAMAQDNVIKHIEGKTVRKVIVIPGKIVNIVAN